MSVGLVVAFGAGYVCRALWQWAHNHVSFPYPGFGVHPEVPIMEHAIWEVYGVGLGIDGETGFAPMFRAHSTYDDDTGAWSILPSGGWPWAPFIRAGEFLEAVES